MNTLTVICAVAAKFKKPGGKGSIPETYVVDRKKIGLVLTDVPAWVEDTMLFKMLVADGSIKYINSGNKKQVENDPLLGLGADGKEIHVEETTEEKPAEQPKKTRTRKAKEESNPD